MTDPWDEAPEIDGDEIDKTIIFNTLPTSVGNNDSLDPWDEAPAQEEQESDNIGISSFINKGIAETFGAPVDLIAGGLNLIPGVDIKEPFGGSESIKKGFETFTSIPEEGREPETITENIGQVLGETAALLNPATLAIRSISAGSKVASKVANSIYKTMIKHPYLTAISEITGAVGAGTGRGVGEEQFSDNPIMKTVSEITGGVIGGVTPIAAIHTPSLVALKQGKKLLSKLTLPFTKKGARYRAGEFIKGQVKDPTGAIETLSKEIISDLPPAVASGEKRLVALYKGLTDKDPIVDAESIELLSKSIVKLEKEMRKLGHGAPELLAEVTEKRIAALELSMDQRSIKAMERANKKLENIPVANRQSAESRIVRSELDKVRKQENEKVKDIWRSVDKEIAVGTENTKTAYQEILGDLPQAQKGDIPAVLKRNNILKTGDGEITETTIKEMQGLRSKLLENSRTARKNGQFNRARISDNMADAILEDIGISSVNVAPEAKNLQAAIAATRHYKERFESGTIGKILGISKTGAPNIDPSVTLDMSIGRSGAKGALDIDKIVATPEAVEATKRFLARSFTDFSTNKATGAIKPLKAESWIRNNEDILDKFPDLRKKISDASTAQQFADEAKIKMDTRKANLRDPKISVAAKFLNSVDLGVTVKSILTSKNPAGNARQLVSQAKADPTGDALNGLRGSFVDFVMDKSATGAFNDLGEQQLSGRSILNFINKNIKTMNQVFEPDQISRMTKIGKELGKIETFNKSGQLSSDINMEDAASNGLKLFSQVSGAQFGRFIAAKTGGGTVQTPGIFSKKFQGLAKFMSKDKAQQMIHDAVISEDPGLLKALLLPIDKPSSKAGENNLNILINRLNLWAGSSGKRVFGDINNPDPEIDNAQNITHTFIPGEGLVPVK